MAMAVQVHNLFYREESRMSKNNKTKSVKEIFYASKELSFIVRAADARNGKRKQSDNCPARHGLLHSLRASGIPADSVEVGKSEARIYHNGTVTIYRVHPRLAFELKSFDKGAFFSPGEYKLMPYSFHAAMPTQREVFLEKTRKAGNRGVPKYEFVEKDKILQVGRLISELQDSGYNISTRRNGCERCVRVYWDGKAPLHASKSAKHSKKRATGYKRQNTSNTRPSLSRLKVAA